MKLRRQCVWFVLLIGTIAPVNLVPAQTDQETPPADEMVNPLVAKEEMIRDRVLRFEDRMFRLREKLLETEPESAARLAAALEHAGELAVKDQIEAILSLLSDGSRLQKAGERQDALINDLESILATLTQQDENQEAREEEIERLEELKAELDRIIKQERRHRASAGQAGDRGGRAARLGDAIERLDEIIRRQQASRDSGAKLDKTDQAAAKETAQQQADIAADTKTLAEDVKQLAEESSPGGVAQPPSAGSKGSSQQGGESSQEGASQEGKSQEGDQSSGASQQMQSAASDMESAQQKMNQARQELETGDASSATEDQEQALEDLRRARHRLEQAKRALEEESNLERLADEQRETAEQTGALAKKMQGGQPGGQQGGQQGEQQDGQQGESSGEQTPGQQQVEQARGHMDDAAKDLDQSASREATQDQDRALAELEDAAAELEEALRQLRQEEQEEILRDLESRFREMLKAQRAINTATVALHAVGKDTFKRADELRAAELSATQGGLADDAATCLHILEEEGTTVVFPSVIEQLSEDMETVADRLARLNVGILTQAIEEGIVTTLEDILEAIERKRKEMEQQSQMGQPSSGDDQPLLPTSAELKLLRASQVRVNKRTEAIEKARATQAETHEELKGATQKVAHRQEDVAGMARELRDVETGP